MVWRGWGLNVFFVPVLWFFVLIVVLDPGGSGFFGAFVANWIRAITVHANGYHFFALVLALSAVSLLLITRYRSRRVGPNIDQLYFIPVKYWAYGFGLGAVGLVIAPLIDKGS